MNKPRPMTPADVLDHMNARLDLTDQVAVQEVNYDTDSLILQDDSGRRFVVTVTEVTL